MWSSQLSNELIQRFKPGRDWNPSWKNRWLQIGERNRLTRWKMQFWFYTHTHTHTRKKLSHKIDAKSIASSVRSTNPLSNPFHLGQSKQAWEKCFCDPQSVAEKEWRGSAHIQISLICMLPKIAFACVYMNRDLAQLWVLSKNRALYF
jgi:hypothetical protein